MTVYDAPGSAYIPGGQRWATARLYPDTEPAQRALGLLRARLAYLGIRHETRQRSVRAGGLQIPVTVLLVAEDFNGSD